MVQCFSGTRVSSVMCLHSHCFPHQDEVTKGNGAMKHLNLNICVIPCNINRSGHVVPTISGESLHLHSREMSKKKVF